MMAKRKGKSRNRIKDWLVRLDPEDFEHTEVARQRFSRKEVKLPERDLSAGAEDLTDLPRVEGMVLGQFPGGVIVRVDGEELLCSIAGTFRAPEGSSALAVGDVVTIALTRSEHTDRQKDIDKDRSDGVLLERRPRTTVLCRPMPRSGKRRDEYGTEAFEKVIAANLDILLIVAATCQPPLRHGLIDRFLIIAERGKLTPVLAVNKTDLAPPDDALIRDFESLGLEVIPCSAKTGDGLESLSRRLSGKQTVLAGASGVGKSTLINAIVPDADAATRTVREKDQRGRHTTSATVVYGLPGGGIIVDTPGLRELGIRLDEAELSWYFPEFEAVAGQCKFRNCTHTHEPDCAVIEGVEQGRIIPRRYRSYLNILETSGNNRN